MRVWRIYAEQQLRFGSFTSARSFHVTDLRKKIRAVAAARSWLPPEVRRVRCASVVVEVVVLL